MKIKYPITRYLNTYIAQFAPLNWMEGCAELLSRQKLRVNSDTYTTQTHLTGLMQEPVPRRSVVKSSGHASSQEGHNIHPLEGQVKAPTRN